MTVGNLGVWFSTGARIGLSDAVPTFGTDEDLLGPKPVLAVAAVGGVGNGFDPREIEPLRSTLTDPFDAA